MTLKGKTFREKRKKENKKMKDTKQQWFKDAKFGLFIHWGLYALLAGEYNGRKTDRIAEWIMNDLDIPVEEYEKLASQFNPVEFDAEMIVRKAKEWGMKYIVFTSKHHEGFAMWDSKCSDYNVVKATPYGRDIVRQFREACDKYDMKLGFYYSQAQDWHDPDGYIHRKDNSKKNYRAYLERKCFPQLRELLTEYGDVALIWFDTPMGTTKEESQEMVDLVKSLQPNCIVSGRIGNELGEYMTTGDNFIPRLPYEGDWEVPATLNDTWGFNKDDHNWKDPEEIIRLLVKINSRGGNYLLNIGPEASGHVPDESIRILDEVGKYVNENEEAIFRTKRVGIYAYELDWGMLTRKDHKLYVHVFKPRKRVELINIANKITGAYLVADKRKLEFKTSMTCEGNSAIDVELPEDYFDRKYFSVCLEMEEEEPIFEPIIG
ncbi:alpha-L-fucosidase [Schaedlerella sp.]|uniref:alpha-L-fucosidase n=1 Tax=Schaedlerella sp. TaxID=2676057 RepID=UPI0026355312|nr:alpha-L-fucosidase [uncultured Schaedlerella sp.]